jgi:hypothetical protein
VRAVSDLRSEPELRLVDDADGVQPPAAAEQFSPEPIDIGLDQAPMLVEGHELPPVDLPAVGVDPDAV